MELSADELAGIVDLFGALTRAELQQAAAELAFKRDGEFEPDAFAADVDAAVRSYHLLAVDADAVGGRVGDADAAGGEVGGEDAAGEDAAGEDVGDTDGVDGTDDTTDDASHEGTWIVPGPMAFPSLPEGATDLPHILDVGDRTVDRSAAGRAAEERFRGDAAAAVEAGDDERIAELLDVSYELEAWAPVDLAVARDRLDDAAG